MNQVNHTFKSFDELLQWKEEKGNNTNYVQCTSSCMRSSIQIHYFCYNRSKQKYDIDDFGQNDFLVMQIAFQQNMMTNFGTNIICVDTAYNINIYNFNLISHSN